MRTVVRQFSVSGADTPGRYAAESGYTSGATAPRALGLPRMSQTVRDSTVPLASLFGDGQSSTEVCERQTFTQRDFCFTQFAENLFDGVTLTWHAALPSARS